MKKVICLSASLVCMLSAAVGCGSKKDEFVGKWECSELVMEGQSSDNLFGAPAYSLFQIEIEKDNKGKFYSYLMNGFMGEDEPMDITWEKKDDNSIDLTIIPPKDLEDSSTSETFTLTKDGDKVLIDMSEDMSDTKAYFTKVDEFTPIPEDTEMSFSSSMDTSVDVDASSDDLNVEVITE
ncbi:MAG: hypothetical protein J6X85_06835 [Ruminococcus sp.]|nr:hypothetical protein [Ruminococcus sp.]